MTLPVPKHAAGIHSTDSVLAIRSLVRGLELIHKLRSLMELVSDSNHSWVTICCDSRNGLRSPKMSSVLSSFPATDDHPVDKFSPKLSSSTGSVLT